MTDLSPPMRAHMISLAPRWVEWQSQVPRALDFTRRKWNLEVLGLRTRSVGSSLYDVRVRGRDAVLKLARPGAELARQADVLAAARGYGYVHLFDRDDEHGALLLERLGRSLEARAQELFRPVPAELAPPLLQGNVLIEPMIGSLQEAWRLPPDAVAAGADVAHRATVLHALIHRLADELGVRDRYGAAVDRALVYTDHRLNLRSASREVLCHGDPHLGNLLEVLSPRPGAPDGYVFVDPDGIVCEPEYDLGVVLRGFNRLVLAAADPVVEVRGWCATLASLTGTDAEAIWQWAFIERVGSGLYLMEQGWPERGQPFLEAASWLIARKGS
nr:phosphotransferase [Propionibacterium sp.]